MEKKRKKHEKRDLARIMFVTSDMTAKDIAKALDLNEKSVAKWREEDNWDEEKTIRNVSPLALIKRLNESIMSILDDAKDDDGQKRALTPGETDAISKLSRSIKHFRNNIDPQTCMEVLNGYTGWLSTFDLELAKAVADKNIVYIQMKLKEQKDK
jgi:hypothetical protein